MRQKSYFLLENAYSEVLRDILFKIRKCLGNDYFTVLVVKNHDKLTVDIFKRHVVISEIVLGDFCDIRNRQLSKNFIVVDTFSQCAGQLFDSNFFLIKVAL